ncbi:MAG: hypothetical protein ABFC96_09140 [Thermoguttaceae bacterium]
MTVVVNVWLVPAGFTAGCGKMHCASMAGGDAGAAGEDLAGTDAGAGVDDSGDGGGCGFALDGLGTPGPVGVEVGTLLAGGEAIGPGAAGDPATTGGAVLTTGAAVGCGGLAKTCSPVGSIPELRNLAQPPSAATPSTAAVRSTQPEVHERLMAVMSTYPFTRANRGQWQLSRTDWGTASAPRQSQHCPRSTFSPCSDDPPKA